MTSSKHPRPNMKNFRGAFFNRRSASSAPEDGSVASIFRRQSARGRGGRGTGSIMKGEVSILLASSSLSMLPEEELTSTSMSEDSLGPVVAKPLQKEEKEEGGSSVHSIGLHYATAVWSATTSFFHFSWILRDIEQITTAITSPSTNNGSDDDAAEEECLFWSSRFAMWVYSFVLLAVLLQRPVALYGILLLLLHKIASACLPWLAYHFRDNAEARRALRNTRAFLRLVVRESEKAVEGDYARLVAAGYVLYNCTAPGESYLSHVIRYKMSMLNHRLVDEMRQWGDHRLGYERSKTKRNLFA